MQDRDHLQRLIDRRAWPSVSAKTQSQATTSQSALEVQFQL